MARVSEDAYVGVLELACEAGIEPGAWDALLRRLADLTGSVAGGLTYEDPATGRGHPLVFFGFDEDHVSRVFDHYLPMNPLFAMSDRMRPGAVVTNEMAVDSDTFRRSEFYNGWARPQGLCSPVTLVLHRENGAYSPLTLVRADGAGEASGDDCTLLKRLAPHLMRAFRTGLRLRRLQERTASLEAAFSRLETGVVLLNASGRVVFRNAAAETVLCARDALRLAKGDTLVAAAKASNDALQAAIRRTRETNDCPAVDVRIEKSDGRPLAATVHAVRVDQEMLSHGAPSCSCLVLIHDPATEHEEATAARTALLYGLTAAETRVLGALLAGDGLVRASERLGVSRATAHSHLKVIFEKTETRRQGELIALALR